MEQVSIKIDEIKINPGRREVDKNVLKDLVESMDEFGLFSPIIVDTEHTLVAGLHRIEAAKLLGWTEISGYVGDFNELQAELAEIDENFVRSPLSGMERNELLLRRKQIYEELHPETKNGGDKCSEKSRTTRCRSAFEQVKPFTQDAADRLHLSRRTVERCVHIASSLTPEAKKVIRGAEDKFPQKEELKLTHVEAAHQEEAAKQYLAGKIRSVSEYKPDNPGATDEKSEDEPQEDGTMPIKPETPRAEESPHSAAVETVSVPTLPQPDTENHDVSALVTPISGEKGVKEPERQSGHTDSLEKNGAPASVARDASGNAKAKSPPSPVNTENHDVSVLESPISSENGVKKAERQQSGHTDTDSPEKSGSSASVAQDAPKAAKTESPPPKEQPRRVPTIKEIVADLKDADKERPCTPDIFMMEFGRFIEGLIDHIEWFEMPDYTGVFSELTEEQYQTLHEKQKSVRSSMDKFMKLVRRKMKK